MSRAHVLCVSRDRSTRATVTLSLSDTDVRVAIAQSGERAIGRLQREAIDAVVVDASTVVDVPELVDELDARWPGTPTFVHWGEGDERTVSVLTEVIARAGSSASSGRLSDAVTERIGSGVDTSLGGIVKRVKRRLVETTAPNEIERIVREEITEDDRFAFAWAGEYDRGEREVVPWITDPESVSWPVTRTFSIGDGEQPVLERALHTRELQTIQTLSEHESVVPLGSPAVERDVDALAVAPLVSDDDRYGVLVVYAVDLLADSEREAIRTIAKTTSRALESIAVRGQLDQHEQVLRRYERLVETAGDGMYVLDSTGHFTTVNDALLGMTGYSREGLLGEHVSLLFEEPPEELRSEERSEPDASARGTPGVESTILGGPVKMDPNVADDGTDRSSGVEVDRWFGVEVGEDLEQRTIEVTLEGKRGETTPCEIQLAMMGFDGSVDGAVAVVRDVTERKQRERRLREQNERLEAFASIVSHDLRNPLGVSQGYLEMIDEGGGGEMDPTTRTYFEKVQNGLARMETIIDDVLTIARDGRWASEINVVSLDAVVEDAWETVETGNATLVRADPWTLKADRSRLRRLLENLFRNAIEHGGASVEIRVGAIERDGVCGFFVEDDGVGLPDEMEESLFDADVTTGGGLGLGLWIAREVAQAHGWTVKAEASGEGGARFVFQTEGAGVE